MTKHNSQSVRRLSRVGGVAASLSHTVLCLIAGSSAVLAVIGQFGRFSQAADAVNYVMPIWFTAGLVATLSLLIFRGWSRWAGGAAACILVVAAGPGLWRGLGEGSEEGASQLRIVQFNTLKRNTSPQLAADWILRQHPDIVVLEEAALHGGRVRDLVKMQLPYAVDCIGEEIFCSTVILSRKAPVETGGLAEGDPENRTALSAAWARFAAPNGGDFTVVGVHMGRPWPFGDQTNSLALLHDFTSLQDQRRLIIAGDFNMPPWSFAMQRQDDLLGLARLTGRQPTWPADGTVSWMSFRLPPVLPIDHIYAGHDWVATAVVRGPGLGSDHRPIVVDLSLQS